MGRAMLQRLKFANQFAELLALPEIGDGPREYFIRRAEQFSGDGGASGIESAFQGFPSLAGRSKNRIGRNRDVVEFEPRRIVRIDHRSALDLESLCLPV